MKKKIKKAVNMAVAVTLGYSPLIFINEKVMIVTMIIGMCAIVCVSYYILEALNNK